MTPKTDFLLIGSETIIPKGSINTENFGKTSLFLSNKYVLVHVVLESTRSIFVGHIHFKKLMKFQKSIEIFHCSMTRLRRMNWGVFMQCKCTRTILSNKIMGQSLLKQRSKFLNFNEIFYWRMTRLRNTILGVFIHCQYTKIIPRNKNIWQIVFRKHSKFESFNEIFYCGMTKLRNTNSDVFIQCQYTRTILRKKIWAESD